MHSDLKVSQSRPENQIKAFSVLKISKRTIDTDLIDYFDQFGEVIGCHILSHDGQGSSAGYASLRMKFSSSTQEEEMVSAGHYLKGHKIILQSVGKKIVTEYKSKKVDCLETVVYAFNIPPQVTEERLHRYFSEFGDIRYLIVQKDKYTMAHRGFCRLVYLNQSSADQLLSQPALLMDGYSLQIKTFETTKKSLRPLSKLIDKNTGVKRDYTGSLEPLKKEISSQDDSSSSSSMNDQSATGVKTHQGNETSKIIEKETDHTVTCLISKNSGSQLFLTLTADSKPVQFEQFTNQCLMVAKERQVLGGFFNFRTNPCLDAIFGTEESLNLLKNIYRRKVCIGSKNIPVQKNNDRN